MANCKREGERERVNIAEYTVGMYWPSVILKKITFYSDLI